MMTSERNPQKRKQRDVLPMMHLLFIFNVVRHVLAGVCRNSFWRRRFTVVRVYLFLWCAVTVRWGECFHTIQFSVSLFSGSAHPGSRGRCFSFAILSFSGRRNLFNDTLKPGTDTDVPAVHQLIYLNKWQEKTNQYTTLNVTQSHKSLQTDYKMDKRCQLFRFDQI